jgi:hypothetical protein
LLLVHSLAKIQKHFIYVRSTNHSFPQKIKNLISVILFFTGVFGGVAPKPPVKGFALNNPVFNWWSEWVSNERVGVSLVFQKERNF